MTLNSRSGLQLLSIRSFLLVVVGTVFILAGVMASYWLLKYVRGQPDAKDTILFEGVRYQRLVRQSPRLMVIHIITINLRQPGLSLLVTPGDAQAERPLTAQTTSNFLEAFDLQVAVNGDGFTPWYSNSLLSYYPKSGDAVTPLGLAASQEVVYSQNPQDHPVLYISRNNQARFNAPPGRIYNAISGNPILVMQGKPAVGGKDNPQGQADDSPAGQPQPRTAVGLDKNNQKLIIVVVDGRQPGYSQGATLGELANILIEAGAVTAMNLDGGGSSTLVKQTTGGRAALLNSPIDHQIPGRERVVGNHLGIYAPRLNNTP